MIVGGSAFFMKGKVDELKSPNSTSEHTGKKGGNKQWEGYRFGETSKHCHTSSMPLWLHLWLVRFFLV